MERVASLCGDSFVRSIIVALLHFLCSFQFSPNKLSSVIISSLTLNYCKTYNLRENITINQKIILTVKNVHSSFPLNSILVEQLFVYCLDLVD